MGTFIWLNCSAKNVHFTNYKSQISASKRSYTIGLQPSPSDSSTKAIQHGSLLLLHTEGPDYAFQPLVGHKDLY